MISLFAFFLTVSLLIVGCEQKDNRDKNQNKIPKEIQKEIRNENYAIDKPFITASWSPAGPDIITNFYRRCISFYNDGTLIIHTENDEKIKIGDDAPFFEIQISEEEVNKVKELIKSQKFWELPKDVSSESEDGAFYYITLNLTDDFIKVGGLNPVNSQFNEIHDYIFNLVNKKDFNAWTEEIRAYISEKNSD